MMGLALRRAVSVTDPDASYRSAVGLIRRLEALSGKLSGGLDAVGIAEQIMAEADTFVPTPQRRPVRQVGHRARFPPLRYSAGDVARSNVLGRRALRAVLGV